MLLEGVSEQGSRVAVRPERIAAVRAKGQYCWVCVDGEWVCLDYTYEELVRLLNGED